MSVLLVTLDDKSDRRAGNQRVVVNVLLCFCFKWSLSLSISVVQVLVEFTFLSSERYFERMSVRDDEYDYLFKGVCDSFFAFILCRYANA